MTLSNMLGCLLIVTAFAWTVLGGCTNHNLWAPFSRVECMPQSDLERKADTTCTKNRFRHTRTYQCIQPPGYFFAFIKFVCCDEEGWRIAPFKTSSDCTLESKFDGSYCRKGEEAREFWAQDIKCPEDYPHVENIHYYCPGEDKSSLVFFCCKHAGDIDKIEDNCDRLNSPGRSYDTEPNCHEDVVSALGFCDEKQTKVQPMFLAFGYQRKECEPAQGKPSISALCCDVNFCDFPPASISGGDCPEGSWGAEQTDLNSCAQSCDHCVDNHCGKLDGCCPHGCTSGYRGTKCGLDADECTQNNGNCSQVCANTFGSHTCSCRDGYTLDIDGFTCEVCHPGFYGARCKQKCSACVAGTICDHITGKCRAAACAAGLRGAKCEDQCGKGRYGPDCYNRCDRCTEQLCDHVTGACVKGCVAGYTSSNASSHMCNKPCAPGTFGVDCRARCHCVVGEVCNPVGGRCPGDCAPGYTGVACNKRTKKKNKAEASGSTIGIIIGAGVGALLIGVGICIGAYVMRRRNKRDIAKAIRSERVLAAQHLSRLGFDPENFDDRASGADLMSIGSASSMQGDNSEMAMGGRSYSRDQMSIASQTDKRVGRKGRSRKKSRSRDHHGNDSDYSSITTRSMTITRHKKKSKRKKDRDRSHESLASEGGDKHDVKRNTKKEKKRRRH